MGLHCMATRELGIGVDIESISRFRRLNFSKNRKFYEKIFTKREIDYCRSKRNSSQHFAARFCAKEAFIKATYMTVDDYRDIEVRVSRTKPVIVWNKKKYLLSLSHEKDKAIAFVLVNHE